MAGDGVTGWQRTGARLRSLAGSHALALLLAVAAIVGLAALGLWFKGRAELEAQQKEAAEARRLAAQVSLIAARQESGAFASAAALAASEPGLPAGFKDNVRLARYETATLLDSIRLPLGQSLDVEWLQAAAGPRPVLVSWGWSSGVSTIDVGSAPGVTGCGVMPGAPRIRLAADGRWFSMLNLPTHETALLPAPGCTHEDKLLAGWSAVIARRETDGVHVSAVLPLPGPQLLVGWADGRVEMLRGTLAPLPVLRMDSPVVGLLSNTAATAFALLSRSGRLELVDAGGRALARPLVLQRDNLTTTTDDAWVTFVRDADAPTSHALMLDQGAASGRAATVLGLISNPQSASIVLHDLPEGGAPVLDAAVVASPNDGCPRLDLLGAERLVSRPLDPRCGAPGAAVSETRLPVPWADSSNGKGLAAGAFCEGGATMVLGGWHGELAWMRHLPPAAGAPARIDIEHAERSAWDDPVTALACREDGSVHAGFQSAGIKAFRPPLHLQQRLVGVRTIKDYAEVIAEDHVWPVETMQGAGRLEFESDTGELGLLRQGRLVWRHRLAEPASTRPDAGNDKVTAVVVDPLRGRVWALTTLGRLSLIELNTGVLLMRFSTSFYAAAPSKEVALERPRLDGTGQLSFVHRWRDKAFRVVVEDGNR